MYAVNYFQIKVRAKDATLKIIIMKFWLFSLR